MATTAHSTYKWSRGCLEVAQTVNLAAVEYSKRIGAVVTACTNRLVNIYTICTVPTRCTVVFNSQYLSKQD